MKRTPSSAMEPLESRTLLSGAPLLLPSVILTQGPQQSLVHTSASAGSGVTLQLKAGTPFTGVVAFYASPVIDPPAGLSASIRWGDGTFSIGTLQYSGSATGGAPGYQIVGSHTYRNAGTYKIFTTLVLGPIVTPGQPPAKFPSRIVARILSKAIVSPAGNSAGGVTINEVAGQKFSADIGSFNAIAPATNLKALINWGDGTTSTGLLQSAGVIGIDVIDFNVVGQHTYAKAGTFAIQIVVIKQGIGLTPTATPAVQIVATIQSTAVVTTVGPA